MTWIRPFCFSLQRRSTHVTVGVLQPEAHAFPPLTPKQHAIKKYAIDRSFNHVNAVGQGPGLTSCQLFTRSKWKCVRAAKNPFLHTAAPWHRTAIYALFSLSVRPRISAPSSKLLQLPCSYCLILLSDILRRLCKVHRCSLLACTNFN